MASIGGHADDGKALSSHCVQHALLVLLVLLVLLTALAGVVTLCL